ncbi:unnamed protein product [Sphenostylis stenocarpa]|uniref:Uncharacterized protein n=1 Tax=Sphenostylis stenocarpa TaxID=92480 RepID=A0AA86SV84_9FABA|nr:unnamed protein product [Sphenostylis stenocarpa]
MASDLGLRMKKVAGRDRSHGWFAVVPVKVSERRVAISGAANEVHGLGHKVEVPGWLSRWPRGVRLGKMKPQFELENGLRWWLEVWYTVKGAELGGWAGLARG